jgi:phosphoglycerate dehydrogenase-like enzyme
VQPGVAARSLPFEELLGAADAVSLHVPLTPRTRHLIDASALRLMKPGALLINTARGAVLDAGAVAEALRADRLGGAAIDVFDPEPPPEDHPLRHAPRCILTPHIGARTRTALEAMSDVVDDVLAVLDGREPEYPFTDEWG